MNCHHYCNEPLRCPTCICRFWKWAEARTNSPPKRWVCKCVGACFCTPKQPNFYACVNIVSPAVQAYGDRGRV